MLRAEGLGGGVYDSSESRQIAEELTLLRRVRAGLKSVRRFLPENPREIGLARQQLDKLFAGLDS